MTAQTNIHAGEIDELLGQVLDAVSDGSLLVGPSAETIRALVRVLVAREGPRTRVDVLAATSVLKPTMDEFVVASHAADLVEAGSLTLSSTDAPLGNSLVVGADVVFALVATGDRVAALSADDGEFVATARECYREAAAGAPEFGLRTPGRSHVRETLEADVGRGVREDFDAVLDSLETTPGKGVLDEVAVSLLVAARNEVLLYDISKWGEDAGVASKATFSRAKSRLEEAGLIDTEKVPIEVGRPRLRLKPGDDRLREVGADRLAAVARNLLA